MGIGRVPPGQDGSAVNKREHATAVSIAHSPCAADEGNVSHTQETGSVP